MFRFIETFSATMVEVLELLLEKGNPATQQQMHSEI
jgi:hypothetical protein